MCIFIKLRGKICFLNYELCSLLVKCSLALMPLFCVVFSGRDECLSFSCVPCWVRTLTLVAVIFKHLVGHILS